MRKITLIALAALSASAVASAAPVQSTNLRPEVAKYASRLGKTNTRISSVADADRQVASLNARLARARRVAPAATPWCPQYQTLFEYYDGEYVKTAVYESVYDAKGNITQDIVTDEESGEQTRTTYTYNEDGRLACSVNEATADGVEWVFTSKQEMKYDSILKDVIVENRQWIWKDGDWALLGNCYNRVITRNADGNVESVEIQVLYDGVYDPTERFTIEYDSEGRAIAMKTSQVESYGTEITWTDTYECSEMIWDEFNGQLADIKNIYGDGNRVKSMHYVDPSYGDDADQTVTYDLDKDVYVATSTGTIGGSENSEMILTYTVYPYGGYREHLITKDSMMIEMGLGDMLIVATQKYYPQWDLDEEASMYMDFAGEVGYSNYYKGIMTYDEETGLPTQYEELEYNYLEQQADEAAEESSESTAEDGGESGEFNPEAPDDSQFQPMARIEFSGYPTGVNRIDADNDAAAEYYTVDGIRVSKPAKGQLLIVRKGSSVSKLIAR